MSLSTLKYNRSDGHYRRKCQVSPMMQELQSLCFSHHRPGICSRCFSGRFGCRLFRRLIQDRDLLRGPISDLGRCFGRLIPREVISPFFTFDCLPVHRLPALFNFCTICQPSMYRCSPTLSAYRQCRMDTGDASFVGGHKQNTSRLPLHL